MTARAWPALAVAAVSACGTAPAPAAAPAPVPIHISGPGGAIARTQIRNDPGTVTRTIQAPLDQVWKAIPAAYEAVGIPGAAPDAAARAYGNLGFRPRRLDGGRLLSEFIDCGTGITAVPRADEYDVTMAVRTDVTPTADRATVVATTVQATGKPHAVSGNAVYCRSLGTLEARIYDLVLRASGGAP